MQFASKMDICGHRRTVMDNFTSFSHTNTQIVLSLY